MIELAVYNKDGQEVDTLKVDEAVLGGSVRYSLLKQAIVMCHANKRLGTAATKSRSMVVGAGKKAREMHALATLERVNVLAEVLPLPRALGIFANVCLRNKEDWPGIRQYWQSF